jgi:insulysin
MCGNLKSLQVDGMRENLLEFHKKWYSSNIMCLTLSGGHSIETLEKWAIEKFGPVVNHKVEIPTLIEPHPYPKESCQ